MARKGNANQRRELAAREGDRLHFRGRVERFGEKCAFRGPDLKTILLMDVVFADTGLPAADHLWFTVGKWARSTRIGDTLEFDGRIERYIKGYAGRRDDIFDKPISTDYRLAHPTKIVNLGQGALA